jgi:hypothetical protein
MAGAFMARKLKEDRTFRQSDCPDIHSELQREE